MKELDDLLRTSSSAEIMQIARMTSLRSFHAVIAMAPHGPVRLAREEEILFSIRDALFLMLKPLGLPLQLRDDFHFKDTLGEPKEWTPTTDQARHLSLGALEYAFKVSFSGYDLASLWEDCAMVFKRSAEALGVLAAAHGWGKDKLLEDLIAEMTEDLVELAFEDRKVLRNENYFAVLQRALWPAEMNQDAWRWSLVPARAVHVGEDASKNPWFFWVRWFDGAIRGHPIDWVLMHKVALIGDEVWNEGAEAVAAEIARIEAEWLAEQLPQADVLEFDAQKAVFVSRPIPLEAAKLVETTLRQVAFAVQVATTSNCGVNASSTACLYIDFTLEHCRDDPNAIEQNLEIAKNDLDRGVADGTYQADGKLTALVEVLDRAVTDLRAHHPVVAEAWEARIRHKLRLAEADQKQMIVEKATELIAVSSEKLGREMELDAKTIASSSGEVQAGAIRRFFGRVAQMRIVVRSDEVIKRIDASSGYKGTRIVQTLQSLLDFVAGLF